MGKNKEGLNSGIFGGLLLMLIGVFLLLDSLNILKFSAEYILILIGIIFLAAFFASKKPGFLIPGVMLSLFGLTLLIGIGSLPYIWVLSISLSFFAVYLTRQKDTSWALIPGSILLAIALITIFEYYTSIGVFPLILIGFGAYLIIKNYSKAKK